MLTGRRETGNYNGRCGRKQRRLSSGDVYPEAVAGQNEAKRMRGWGQKPKAAQSPNKRDSSD